MRREDGVLKIVFSGTFTNADMSLAAAELGEVERASDVAPHRTLDLRLVDRLEIDFKGVFAVAETRRRAVVKNPVKSAIIASDIVQFGFARMFQTLNDNSQVVLAIFGDEESALEWLRIAGVRPPDPAWHPRASS
jgi:hypothetical protein